MLFVPANNRRMIEKAAASDADAVCLDLEDAVPPEQKPPSRALAARALQQLDFGRRTRILRINSLDTRFAYRDLIDVVEAAGDRLDLIMLPKADGAGAVEFVDRLLTQIGIPVGGSIGIEAQIETAAGFLRCAEIAAASPRLEALIFGPGDFAASMQMPASGIGEFDEHDALYPGHRYHAAMLTLVAAARAHGLRAIDGPYGAYKDAAGLERSCRIALALGFEGKQCIHPAQLAPVNAAFTPPPAAVAHAERVLEAYRQASAQGKGAVSLDGKMVDAANVRQAEATLAKARAAQAEGRERK